MHDTTAADNRSPLLEPTAPAAVKRENQDRSCTKSAIDVEAENESRLLEYTAPRAGENESHGRGCDLDDPKAWRWMIVVASFVGTFMFGLERTFALYYVELMEYFDADSSVTSMIGSIFNAFFYFPGIIILPLSERYGPRVIMMLGGLSVSIGLLTSAFAPNVYVCIAALGFFMGLGCAMTYMNAASVLLLYFNKHRDLAQGIGISGQPAGGIIFPILMQYLNEKYSWRGGLIIAAGISLNLCVAGALVRPRTTETGSQQNKTNPSRDKHENMRYLREMLCLRPFAALCFQTTFLQASISIMAMHMKALVLQKSCVSDEMGSYAISYSCVALFFGMIVTGALTNATARRIEPIVLLEIHSLLCAVGAVMIPVFSSYGAILFFLCIFSYSASATILISLLVICRLVEEHQIRLACGIRYFFCGIGGLAGPTLAGVLYDNTKDYSYSMYVGGCGIFLSVLLLIEPCISMMKTGENRLTNTEKPEKGEMWLSMTSLGSIGVL